MIPQKPVTPIEKKEPQKQQQQQQRKISRKRKFNKSFISFFHLIFSFLGLSSSSSESNLTPENDDSQSRDSASIPNADISPSEPKVPHKIPIDQPTPEEEEGEIKDDDEREEENPPNQIKTEPLPPPPQPSPPVVKKITNKTSTKQNKKPGPPKKRKIEQIKSEPIQEQDDIDNSALAKRKKRYDHINYIYIIAQHIHHFILVYINFFLFLLYSAQRIFFKHQLIMIQIFNQLKHLIY